MHLAYTTTFNATDIREWSGTPYHMSQALAESGMTLDYIGGLKRKLPPFFKMKQIWQKHVANVRESPRFNITAAQAYSEQVARQLKLRNVDAVLSPLINPIAYLECTQPIILWTDAVYAALVGFYPPFAYHSASSVQQGNAITAACLARCKLAIFSSHWAAKTAIEFYGISQDKVSVVNYGANLQSEPDADTVKAQIKKRSQQTIKLLFLAKSWERKGGDIVVAVTQALHEAGYPVELNIVGTTPKLASTPPYIHFLGFISKKTEEGQARLAQLFHESHFLFLPSRADACPMVLAEANAYGLPCLTSCVGGIQSAVINHVNGMAFPLDTSLSTYCNYIVSMFSDRAQYEALAESSHHEYVTRLNWRIATQRVKQLIGEVI